MGFPWRGNNFPFIFVFFLLLNKENNSDALDPSSLPPPMIPSSQLPLSMSASLASPAHANSSAPREGGGYDPLAALMAPPSYRIPSVNSSSNSNSSINMDPLAALMAPPPSRYSSFSSPFKESTSNPNILNDSNNSYNINMWKPPSAVSNVNINNN
jgi:hypothetical protein